MPFQKKAASNFNARRVRTFESVEGLDDFVKVLEKDFFANARVKCQYHADKEKTSLIFDLYCNFGLTETLHNFNNGTWGGFSVDKKDTAISSSFDTAFNNLSIANNNEIDIAEISLHFRDTSIIIAKIYQYSIPEKLGEIISKVSEHFVHFTKGLTDMPYEIFVPVFEDKMKSTFELDKNYFDYWGLYFENDKQHDVVIYSLKSKQLLHKEDFFFLD
ncbi:hypothetical protein KIM67_11665 [Flagellimonas sp. 389]|uniref:hypothetical protein n=1 Tax=Flagellimonas sp. 389 TaxID=2835862 RepID=UPI001BD4F85E|nr:hypothetical protein [Flagellimonas sp. 389]MBS9463069.1 hypothetical protein [Flagellimonas sp. 389]